MVSSTMAIPPLAAFSLAHTKSIRAMQMFGQLETERRPVAGGSSEESKMATFTEDSGPLLPRQTCVQRAFVG